MFATLLRVVSHPDVPIAVESMDVDVVGTIDQWFSRGPLLSYGRGAPSKAFLNLGGAHLLLLLIFFSSFRRWGLDFAFGMCCGGFVCNACYRQLTCTCTGPSVSSCKCDTTSVTPRGLTPTRTHPRPSYRSRLAI